METSYKIMLDGKEIKLPEKFSKDEMDDHFLQEEEPTIDLTEILNAKKEGNLDSNEQ